jgi:hypothetical protein
VIYYLFGPGFAKDQGDQLNSEFSYLRNPFKLMIRKTGHAFVKLKQYLLAIPLMRRSKNEIILVLLL